MAAGCAAGRSGSPAGPGEGLGKRKVHRADNAALAALAKRGENGRQPSRRDGGMVMAISIRAALERWATRRVAAAALAGVVACVAGLVWRQDRLGGLDLLDSRGWYAPGEAAALFDDFDRLDANARAYPLLSESGGFPWVVVCDSSWLLEKEASLNDASLFQ